MQHYTFTKKSYNDNQTYQASCISSKYLIQYFMLLKFKRLVKCITVLHSHVHHILTYIHRLNNTDVIILLCIRRMYSQYVHIHLPTNTLEWRKTNTLDYLREYKNRNYINYSMACQQARAEKKRFSDACFNLPAVSSQSCNNASR